MRLKASIRNNAIYKKLMLYVDEDGVYLFFYTTTQDTSGVADIWFASVEEAKAVAQEDYGVTENDWQQIADPLPGMQHDIEQPTQAMQDNTGNIILVPYTEDVPMMQEVHTPGQSLKLASPQLLREVQSLLAQGKPISAIQHYRLNMNVGLYEAKRAVEQFMSQLYNANTK